MSVSISAAASDRGAATLQGEGGLLGVGGRAAPVRALTGRAKEGKMWNDLLPP